jgi:flavin-dependent dehydrogenase
MKAEVLVIGGGPAGAAAAIHLARRGRDVLLVEREASPRHKVCGEFLSGEAVSDLASLGADLDAWGAVPVDTVALHAGRLSAEAPLPFVARSLSRLRLDEGLLELAQHAGARVVRGRRVTALAPAREGWRAALGDGEAATAGAVCLAVGKHDLRGWRRPPGAQPDLVGFKLHWRLAPDQVEALRGRVELYLFADGYAGLELVEDGLANLCVLVRRCRLAEGWAGLLDRMRRANPVLARRLEGGETAWPRPLAVAALPYGHLAAAADGVWRVGDQAAVIPSFAGDGLAIALHSARLAARMLGDGESPDRFQAALARQLRRQVGRATLLSRLLVQSPLQTPLALAAAARPHLLIDLARATRIAPRALLCREAEPRHHAAA